MDETSELSLLRREVVALRERVAELQRRVTQVSSDESPELVNVASEREELLREAERITQTGSWVWDVTDNSVFWSEQLFRILAYDPDVDEATSEKYFARVHPDDLEYARQVAQQSASSGIARTVDYRLLLPDGEVRWVTLNGAVLFDEDGEPHRLVGTVRDTTDERAAAIALAEAHRLEAVGELAGGVAHDFRNLLMVIRAQLDLLEDLDPEARRTIESAVDSANSVTSQLLAFGQQAQLRPEITDLNTVAEKTESLVRPLLGDAHVLEVNLSTEPLPCRLDARHLGEALSNLLLHVRDAMPDGGGIRITTSRDGEFLCLTIEDDSTEYSPSDRVFEPFFHATAGGRVDLRMAMAHGIVVQHGGHILVEHSELGGTRFMLRFKQLAMTTGEELLPGGAADGLTILVVEDQAPVARVVARLLLNEGHTVYVADRPERAIEIYERHAEEIDVVLTDLAMPGMLGTELIAALETRWSVRHVVFMSGYAAQAEREIADRYELLHKPFTRDQLLHVLNQMEL